METSTQPPEAPMSPQDKQRSRGLTAFVVLGGLLGLVGLLVGWGISSLLPDFDPFGTDRETRDTQVVNSLTLEEEVVLVSLGIQGIAEEKISSTIFGHVVPGTGRTTFLQYNYNAKLGIDGREVQIKQTGEDEYLVTIPPFIFIGHENEEFKTVVEDNGVISFVTPEIDTAAAITKVLNDDVKKQHIEANREILEQQTEAFYAGIIHAVDHEIDVEFEFRRERG